MAILGAYNFTTVHGQLYFFRLDDVKKTVEKMENVVQFRIPAARDNETIRRLYSTERGLVLFALPPKVKIVSNAICSLYSRGFR